MFKMNQPAVFHLHRIERTIATESKRRFRLSDEKDVKELLKIAAASTEVSVRRSLAVFINNSDIQCSQEYQFLEAA